MHTLTSASGSLSEGSSSYAGKQGAHRLLLNDLGRCGGVLARAALKLLSVNIPIKATGAKQDTPASCMSVVATPFA